jgi:hypothetical protein
MTGEVKGEFQEQVRRVFAGESEKPMLVPAECSRPGLCDCPNMPRSTRCGYTDHDKAHLMDRRFCQAVRHAR